MNDWTFHEKGRVFVSEIGKSLQDVFSNGYRSNSNVEKPVYFPPVSTQEILISLQKRHPVGYLLTSSVRDTFREGFACCFVSLFRRIIMSVRGIRGATSVDSDSPELILAATRELLDELLRANEIDEYDEIASILFTTTADLTSTFPAEAARKIGMNQVPLLCANEIPVSGSMPRCIRVLLHWNTEKKQSEVTHVYQREAKKLRPDVNSAQ